MYVDDIVCTFKVKCACVCVKDLLVGRVHIHTIIQLFERIRSERPSALEKVVPISGDCGEPGLGIGESDQQLLADSVSIIFHLAATIKFDAPLRSVIVLCMNE